MQPFFSTDGIHPRNAFRRWREMICERVASVDVQNHDAAPFAGEIAIANIGPLLVTRTAHSAMRSEATPADVRRNDRSKRLFAAFTLSGRQAIRQDDREAVAEAGDLVVFDRRPVVTEQSGSFLVLDLPSERLESALGPARLFTTLTAGADLASTILAKTFVQELVRMGDQLGPDAATRMASIGVDLIVASLAERIAQDVPRSIHGNVTVQRAKAYIEANLGDQTLDPPHLAAAMGVSLRRLQELFHERGRHISDYIWERRLQTAAKRLADPACAHLAIGLLAYGCGFSSQAHFARRFKDRYGTTPRDYRQAALLGAP
jgi:AraC family transcriptional regulator, positive regulator of tynA and feaB